MNAETLKLIGEQLLAIAAAVRPDIAVEVAAVRGVIGAATKLNTIVHEIRTNPDTAAVWDEVEIDYLDATDAWRASVAGNGPA